MQAQFLRKLRIGTRTRSSAKTGSAASVLSAKNHRCTVRARFLRGTTGVCDSSPGFFASSWLIGPTMLAFQPQASGLSRSGSLTPNTKNSLTAIAGHEGDEDDWEGDIDAYAAEEEVRTSWGRENCGATMAGSRLQNLNWSQCEASLQWSLCQEYFPCKFFSI